MLCDCDSVRHDGGCVRFAADQRMGGKCASCEAHYHSPCPRRWALATATTICGWCGWPTGDHEPEPLIQGAPA